MYAESCQKKRYSWGTSETTKAKRAKRGVARVKNLKPTNSSDFRKKGKFPKTCPKDR